MPSWHGRKEPLVNSAAHTNFTADGTATNGRKGIAYDWQSLYAQAAVRDIETELATLQPLAN